MKNFATFLTNKNVPDLEEANKELEDILGFSPLTPTQFKDARAEWKLYKRAVGLIEWHEFLELTGR